MAVAKPAHSDPSSSNDRLLRVPDAANRLGVSVRSIWRLIATEELRSVRIGARGTRIPESALTAYMASLPTAR